MSEFLFRSGEGLMLDQRAGHDSPHVYLALTPVVKGRVAVVNFTSIDADTPAHWKDVALDVGDHDFITKPTCVCFGGAKLAKHESLCNFANERGTDIFGQMDVELHKEILTKLLASKSTPGDVKHFITFNFGPELFKIMKACVIDPRIPPEPEGPQLA